MMSRKRVRQGYGEGDEATSSRHDVITGAGPAGQLTYRNTNVSRRGRFNWVSYINKPAANEAVTYYFGKKTANALASNVTDLAYQLKSRNHPTGIQVGPLSAPATSGANTREFPVHVYTLCDRPHPHHTDVVGHFMYMDGDPSPVSGAVKFGALTGRDGNNGLVNQRVIWSANDPQAAPNYMTGDVRRAVLTRVKAEFLLQGSRVNPTTFHIMFIRIKDAQLGPLHVPTPLRDGLYLNLARPMLGSPMIHTPGGNAGVYKDYEVLHSETVKIMPDTSTDLDVSAPKKHLTINFKINQAISWDYREVVPLQRGLNINPNYWQPYYRSGEEPSVTSNTNAIPPDETQRCFMIIRASNPNEGVESGNTVPQYDLDLKMTHVFKSIA